MDGWKENKTIKKQIDTKMEDWMDRKIWMVGWIEKKNVQIDGWLNGYTFFLKIDCWLDGQEKNRRMVGLI